MRCPRCRAELPPVPTPVNCLPLPVPLDDDEFQVINVPRMNLKAFEFFKSQLEVYKELIIIKKPIGTGTGIGADGSPMGHSLPDGPPDPRVVALAGGQSKGITMP